MDLKLGCEISCINILCNAYFTFLMRKLCSPNIITVYRSSICTTVLLDKEEIGAIYEICKMPSNQNGTCGMKISHA